MTTDSKRQNEPEWYPGYEGDQTEDEELVLRADSSPQSVLTPEQIAYAQRLHEKGYNLPYLASILRVTVEELRQVIEEVR